MIKGKLEGRSGPGRKGKSYIRQIKDKVGVMSNQKVMQLTKREETLQARTSLLDTMMNKINGML